LDKYFLLYSHYIFWNVMVLLLEYVFSVLFPPLRILRECSMRHVWLYHLDSHNWSGQCMFFLKKKNIFL